MTEARFTSRPREGDRDLARMYELAASAPSDALHVADLPWRLASPSAAMPERTRLWEDTSGTLVAWAALQFSWHCLDYATRLDALSDELEAAVLAWAGERLAAEDVDRAERLPFYVSAGKRDVARIAAIERAGFARAGWGYVRLVRSLDQPIPEHKLPAEFAVRPLAGEREVDAYVAAHRAAFGSANMTVDWRQATLRDPRYIPELDLVAIAPEGTIVGFCVCWITPPLDAVGGRRVAQIEPLGVLPEYQRRGLGRALLLEGCRRAKARGADRMEVDAVSDNSASQEAYKAIGFRPALEAPFFLRTFG
ncbi:MAG: GNAT family N-acetyltransferase [Thermomicrobiales bacterium]